MLVRFSSIKTESIIMFGDAAVQLIKLIGASGAIPGAIRAEDIPQALIRLRHELAARAPHRSTTPNAADTAHEENAASTVDLATRAVPLIDILQRALAGNAPVMWELN